MVLRAVTKEVIRVNGPEIPGDDAPVAAALRMEG
jgi:hypothetical protein